MVKKILYCESNIDGTIGGSYYSLYFLVSNLPEDEFKPLVVFHTDHALMPQFHEAGIDCRIWPLPSPYILPESAPRIFRALQRGINLHRFLFKKAKEYARFLHQEKVDLVHLNNSVTRNHAWMLAAAMKRIPCITHQRGINNNYALMDRWIGGRTQKVVCISEAVKRNLTDHGFDTSRIRVIYNGLDPQSFCIQASRDTLLNRIGINGNRPVLGMLGNIKEWKGQEVLLRAVASLRKRFPSLVCLLVGDTASGDEYYRRRLQELVADSEMEDNVHFVGYQKNVADWLNIMDIMVHASIEPEPFGRVFLEAMAMQKPVIASNAGGVAEIVENELTGLLYPPGDAAALEKAIERMLDHPQWRRALGKAGYERLQSRFHVNENIDQTRRLYRELLA